MRTDRLINVFLSSTFLDLEVCRQHAYAAMMRCSWVNPLGMEFEPALDRGLLEYCLQQVGECQICVGVVASRYGMKIEDWQGRLSVTHRELNYASELDLYRILILSQSLDKEKADDYGCVQKLRTEIGQCYVGYFDEKNPATLANAVGSALARAWDVVNGMMEIGVRGTHEEFVGSPQALCDLRRCIARDAGVSRASMVWLVHHSSLDMDQVLFHCFLPNANKLRYLQLKERSGNVEWAVSLERNDPKFPFIWSIIRHLLGHWKETAYHTDGSFAPAENRATSPPARISKGADHMSVHKPDNSVPSGPEHPNEATVRADVPMIAFFGTKGGVGKTTIMDKWAGLLARSTTGPTVLLVDFDVHHRGLTVLRTKDRFGACTTLHEYLADPDLGFSTAQDVTPTGDPRYRGREFLIPSSNLAAEGVFAALVATPTPVLLDRIRGILRTAIEKHDADIVLIDCGPIVDPLTASAAYLADMAFIIGQNEPISFQALQNYTGRIGEFFPDYDGKSVRVILNKVRGVIPQQAGIYAAIPFAMEVVDYSEGIPNIDEVRLIFMDRCVYGILKRTLAESYPKLVPTADVMLTVGLSNAVGLIDKWPQTRWYSRSRRLAYGILVGCTLMMVGILLAVFPGILGGNMASGTDGTTSQPASEATTSALVGEDEQVGVLPKTESLARGGTSWVGGGGILIGAILVSIGVPFRHRWKQALRIIQLKQRGGCEGLLELLGSRKGRRAFSAIRVLSAKTEKEPSR